MNTRLKLIVLGALTLILLSGWLAWESASAQAPVTQTSPGYILSDPQIRYRQWQANGEAQGGDYRLQPLTPQMRGSGCCCTYLPCTLKEVP
ncbi:MAG: hypothetical protein JW726_04205 [Anaerolineales bacterium]|nr:hypothetical protein [Anaerolineales bacterium]